jgi:predicted MPP superfamily phosphohydrolase
MNLRVRDPFSPLALIEARLGTMRARQRLAIEREHEARASGQGFTFLHMQNMSIKQMMIEVILRATGTCWWGHANAGKVQLRRNEVRLLGLPEAFDGFTILHLSDLHADMSASALERVAELALDLEYDLCVLTGDYRARTYGDHEPCLERVASMREVLHADIYAVLGNHDSLAMVPALEALGIRVLLNESVAIQRGADKIYLAGVDDAHFYHTDDIEKAAAHIPEGSAKILLSHSPEIYGKAAQAGFDLMLSGHTHGGQICLPGGVPIILEADLPRAFAAGAWRHEGMAGYTSVGAGSCLVPVRFNNRPEITLHRLVGGDSG